MSRNRQLLLTAAAAVGGFASCAQAQMPGQAIFALPAQELSASLRAVSRKTGRNIIAPSTLVKGRQAPAVSGPFTPEDAVRLLLTGSGLEVRQVGDTLIVMRQVDAGPGPGPRPAQPAEAAGSGETIVVTGTHIRGAPATAPTIVITRDEIDRTGVTSVEELMRKVPQNFAGGVNQENFDVTGAGADPTEHGAGINLRGLGQRATLVLIDGQRMAPSGDGSFVDISMIPLSAVERVEIVTDGASAIYGSDAVGGVVNFILRDRFSGLETSVLGSTTTDGGGEEVAASATAGRAWAGGHILLSYEYRDAQPIYARQRPFTINLAPDTTLLPDERRNSVFGAFSQQLSDRLKVDIQASWAQRDTDRTYFFLGTPLPVDAAAEATSTSIDAAMSYRLWGDWLIHIGSDYSLSVTHEIQQQPGASIELENLFDTRNELFENDGKVDGSLFSLPGGPVKLAVGGSVRDEHYNELFATGTLAPAYKDQGRSVEAAFGEISIPLFSDRNARFGLEKLIVDGAVRYEHYDAFGSSVNPRVGALWSPLRGLTLRGSYDTSFRAPLLSEMGGVYSAFYFPASRISVTPIPAGRIALVMSGSNPAIRPERSRSWTAGGDFEPGFAPGLKLTANFYSIRFSNRIALPSQTTIVLGNPAFDPIIARNPPADLVASLVAGAAAVRDITGPGLSNGHATPADVDYIVDLRFNNTAVTTTSGLDFGVHYPLAIGANHFVLDADANYILSFRDQLTATAPAISDLDKPYEPVDLQLRSSLAWSRGPWSADLAVQRADGYLDARVPTAVAAVGAFTTVDAGIGYQIPTGRGWLSGLRIALTGQNVLDARPPLLLPNPGSTSGLGYDPVNATGRGRVITVQIRKAW